MATQTTNYKLIKPGDGDPIDIAVLNQNFDIIDAKIAEIRDLVAEGFAASKLKITFDSDFVGMQYTITGGTGESYTGTVPQSLIVEQTIKTLDTAYTVTCASSMNGIFYDCEIVVGNFYGVYSGKVRSFQAYIECYAAEGTEVKAVCGDKTYTGTVYRGLCGLNVWAAGAYRLTGTLGGKITSPVTVDVTTEDETYICNLPSPSIPVAPWATGTDEEIAAMVAALDAGTLSIEDTGWSVGDKRTVQLGAMAATGVGEAHEAQAVELVLSHPGATAGITRADGKPIHFQVDQVDSLKEKGYMDSDATASGSWSGCARRTWCNAVYYAAIPETLRGIFKKMKVTTAESTNGSPLKESEDFFALRAEQETFGTQTYSATTEARALAQVEWYKTAANRKKNVNGSAESWWERSPDRNDSSRFCNVNSGGTSGRNYADFDFGLAPFGCI